MASYRAGRDGLKGNRVDTFWRPSPIPVFEYPPPERGPTPAPDAEPKPAKKQPDAPEGPAGTAYPPKRNLDGVDTSHHQGGRIDLKAARADGLQWWYVKATEGDAFVDPTYAKRVRQARKAGVPVGAYHFARPDRGDADDEARFFLVEDRHPGRRHAADARPRVERGTQPGRADRLDRHLGAHRDPAPGRARPGGRPIIYTPFNLEKGFGCFCWVARYSNDFRAPVVPRPWQRAVIWQHSNGRFGPVKNVPGFGPVDVNAVHPDVPLAALRVRRAERPTPPPQRHPHRRRRRRPWSIAPAPTDPGQTAMQDVRLALVTAARSIEAAIDRLPER